jgi:chemotaxis protein methyltransferase CheR
VTLTATGFDWVRQLVHRESAIVLSPGKEYLVEARLLPIARSMGCPTSAGWSTRSAPGPAPRPPAGS